MADRPDLDERFSLHPLEGEDVLRELVSEDAEEDCPDEDAETA